MSAHLSARGIWQPCKLEPGACPELHLPGIDTVEAGRALPELMLEPLIEAFEEEQPVRLTPGVSGLADPLRRDLDWNFRGRVRVWYLNGKRGRRYGLPAVVEEGGARIWYQDGKIHRDGDLPAVINPRVGLQVWMQDGKLHRDDGKPAIVNRDLRVWYEYGQLTRERERWTPGKAPVEIPLNLQHRLSITGVWSG